MNKLTINACPLCEGMHLKRVMACKDYYASGEEFDLFCCEDCSFRFTQNFPEEAEIGKYYETPEYISHSDTKKGVMNKLYHVVRKYMLNQKAGLVFHFTGKKSGKILDIGTGTGYFVHAMRQKGWKADGVEKNTSARSFAKEHFNLDVKDDSELKEFEAGKFDAITLWHVMEHLEKLDYIWNKLYELLSDKGILIVAVPNCSSYDAEKYKEYWAAYDVPRHLWHFTPSTMQQLGMKHNFILLAQRTMPFDAFYVSILSEKYKGSSFPFMKGMYTGMAAWFASLAKKGRSSSVIYIFRKKE